MRNLRKNILGLCLVGMGLVAGVSALAATGVGPYYAMPSWGQTLPAATRFIVLTNMNSEAVLDRETGLVWLQKPLLNPRQWDDSVTTCAENAFGNRWGWRLPSIQELSSLLDTTAPASPAFQLPVGHPFGPLNPTITAYWSSTTSLRAGPSLALVITPSSVANNPNLIISRTKTLFAGQWCVRSGTGNEAQ